METVWHRYGTGGVPGLFGEHLDIWHTHQDVVEADPRVILVNLSEEVDLRYHNFAVKVYAAPTI